MYGESFLIQALIYLAAAVVAVPVAKRLGLGSVLGYLVAGILIGPFGLGLVGEEGQDVMHFAEFGVVMMLFLVGLELQPSLLWRMRLAVLGVGGAQVVVTAALITGAGLFLGLPWQAALAIGLTLSLSSTAIVLQSLEEKGLLKCEAGQTSFAVLLFQDVAVIPILALLPLLSLHRAESTGPVSGHGSGSQTWLDAMHLPGWAEALLVLLAVIVVIVAGRFLIGPFLRFVASTRLRETFTAAALLIVIAIALLMAKVGVSPALGTFLAGVVLATSEFRHELESDIEPFKGLLLGVFFIAVGASIDFALVASQPTQIATIVGTLVLAKLLVLFVLGRLFKMGLDQNLIFTFALAQGGEFAFVLFSFAARSGVLTPEETAPLIASVALTMALTPLLMILNERVILPIAGTRESVEREPDRIDRQSAVIVAGFGEFGSTVVRFLRANGVRPTVLDSDSERIELLRRHGLHAYYGDARRRDLLDAAGAKNARILVVAVRDQEQTIEVIRLAQKHYPQLTIYARTIGWFQAFEIIKLGVHHVYRENQDTALRVGIDALRDMGLPESQLNRSAARFREHDEQSMFQLSGSWGEDPAYFSLARERIEDLERVMLDELQRSKEEK